MPMQRIKWSQDWLTSGGLGGIGGYKPFLSILQMDLWY